MRALRIAASSLLYRELLQPLTKKGPHLGGHLPWGAEEHQREAISPSARACQDAISPRTVPASHRHYWLNAPTIKKTAGILKNQSA